jgi:hypothetical protein
MRSSRQPASGWLRKRRPVSFDLGKGTLAQISKKVDARIRLSCAGPRLRVFSPPSDVTPGGQPASRFTWKTDGSSAPTVLTAPGCVSIILNINKIIFNFFLMANLLRSEVFTAMAQNGHPHNLTPAE